MRRSIKEADPKVDAVARREGTRLWNRVVLKIRKLIDASHKKNKSEITGPLWKTSHLFYEDMLDIQYPNLGKITYVNIGSLLGETKYISLYLGIGTELQQRQMGAAAYFRAGSPDSHSKEIVILELPRHPQDNLLNEPMFSLTEPDSYQIRQLFIHEFIHYLDSRRHKDPKYPKLGTSTRDPKTGSLNMPRYYNNPKEFNAHTQELLGFIEKFYVENFFVFARTTEEELRKNHEIDEQDKKRLLARIDVLNAYIRTPKYAFNKIMEHIAFSRTTFFTNLSPENKKKFQQRVYQFYVEILEPKFRIAFKSLLKSGQKLNIKPTFESKEHNLLPFAIAKASGYVFKSGHKIKFPYIKNTEKRLYINKKYQQDIEPDGTYLQFDSLLEECDTGAWTRGEITIENPMVILWNTKPDGGHDETSWKALLSRKYNATGNSLSNALKSDGYDSIVTVDPKTKQTKDIVIL